MELKRRRKEEEKTSTENKIEQVKVSEFQVCFNNLLKIISCQKSIQNAERSKARKEYLQETVLPFCVGLVMFVAGGYFYFRHVRP